MKLTWMGGRCLRLHIGGCVLCFYPETAASRFTQVEILGAVDNVITPDTHLEPVNGSLEIANPTPKRLIDTLKIDSVADDTAHPPRVLSLDSQCLIVLADGESALVSAFNRNSVASLGQSKDGFLPRDLENCILLVYDASAQELNFIAQAVRERRVKQIVVAVDDPKDTDWAALKESGAGIPMQFLEMGLGLEV